MTSNLRLLVFGLLLAALAQSAFAQRHQNAPSLAPAPAVAYTLRSGIAEGRMVFLGVGGAIDGKVDPELVFHEGE